MTHADERKVKQVLLNLLSKASKVNARGRPHRRRGLRAWQRDRPLPARKEVCEVRFSCCPTRCNGSNSAVQNAY